MKRIMLGLMTFAILFFAKEQEKVVERYLKGIRVGTPVEYKNLKIFPLEINTPLTFKDFMTLDEAMDRGWIKIKEVGSGVVNTVQIKNNGEQPVFILTGEMITGAKQDRMIKADVLLPSNSGWIEVEVYCVEHGRWVSVSNEFKSEGFVVPNAVRQRAKICESQTDVWDEVARTQDKLGISSVTGTVRANYEDKSVQKAIEDYTAVFKKVPQLSKSTIGVVVTTGDKIICFDLFASNSLLNKFWKKLVKSYAMDAIRNEKSSVTKSDIEDFIETFEDAKFVSVGTPGLGDLLTIESSNGKGSCLVYEKAVVHMDFFPSDDNLRDDSGWRLDFRRDQRRDNR
ncbi:MAG: ARPP-1 family domain-containing protein [bacterium]